MENKKNEPTGILLLRLTIKHRVFIGVAVLVAMAGTYLFTSPFFIKPRYKSEAIIYPPGANTSTSLINSEMRFGADRDIDNAMQVLQSGLLRDSIKRKFDLMRRYEIDTTDPLKDFLLHEEYDDNITIERTKYSSIIVRVFDTDPVMAAAIANSVVTTSDRVKSEIIKKNLKSAVQSVERELKLKIGQIGMLADTINYLKRSNYNNALVKLSQHFAQKKGTVEELRHSLDKVRNEQGIYDLDKQFDALYAAYLHANTTYVTDSGIVEIMRSYYPENDTALVRRKASMAGARVLAKSLKDKLNNLNRQGALYNSLQDRYSFEKSVLSNVQGDYEISKSTFEKEYDNLALTTLKSKHNAELAIFNTLQARYDLALSNLTDLVPSSYIISPAEASMKKVYPRRGLLTLLAGISAYLLTLSTLLAASNFRRIQSALSD